MLFDCIQLQLLYSAVDSVSWQSNIVLKFAGINIVTLKSII